MDARTQNPQTVEEVVRAVDRAFRPDIILVVNWRDAQGVTHYRPLTVGDGDRLRSLGAPRYPKETDLDRILDLAAPFGWCVETRDGEPLGHTEP